MLAGIIAIGYYHQLAAGGTYTLDLLTLLNSHLDGSVQVWLLLAFADSLPAASTALTE